MMIILDFIFKYIWVAMLVLIYVIWGIVSIKDIIEKLRRYQSLGFAGHLEESTDVWIMVSVIFLFITSLGYWLFCIGGGE